MMDRVTLLKWNYYPIKDCGKIVTLDLSSNGTNLELDLPTADKD